MVVWTEGPLTADVTHRPAILALEDGRVFNGRAAGALTRRGGEVVFNTSLTGYQEVFTDPSYAGQIVCLTYPHIGNVGANLDDEESGRPYIESLIVREFSQITSNWRSAETAQLHKLESQGLAIGVMPEWEYETGTVPLGAYARLLVYSDGVYEVEKPNGEMWATQEFLDYLTGLRPEDGSVIDRLLAHVRQLHGGEVLADDFSMMEIVFA